MTDERKHPVMLRFTDEEHARIFAAWREQLDAYEGRMLPLSMWLRELVLGCMPKAKR